MAGVQHSGRPRTCDTPYNGPRFIIQVVLLTVWVRLSAGSHAANILQGTQSQPDHNCVNLCRVTQAIPGASEEEEDIGLDANGLTTAIACLQVTIRCDWALPVATGLSLSDDCGYCYAKLKLHKQTRRPLCLLSPNLAKISTSLICTASLERSFDVSFRLNVYNDRVRTTVILTARTKRSRRLIATFEPQNELSLVI